MGDTQRPSAQVIAFSRKYACMYTKDVHKKAKTWHDGFLFFHHKNSKLLLQTERGLDIDECFYRPSSVLQKNPGRNAPLHTDVPRDIVIQEGEMVDEFEQHLVEVGEVLAQEEKDISDLFNRKKRKQDIEAFDAYVESGGREAFQPDGRDEKEGEQKNGKKPESLKRKAYGDTPGRCSLLSQVDTPTHAMRKTALRTNAQPGRIAAGAIRAMPAVSRPRNNSASTCRKPEDLQTGDQSRHTFEAGVGHEAKGASPKTGSEVQSLRLRTNDTPSTRSINPTKQLVAAAHSGTPISTTPFRTPSLNARLQTTPFKPPTLASAPQTPLAHGTGKKRLGTSRPSSVLARQSLQLDWTKFAEKAREQQDLDEYRSSLKQSKGRASVTGGSDSQKSPAPAISSAQQKQRQEETRAKLREQNLGGSGIQSIVHIGAKRRDGEEGDTTGWLFD